MPDRKTVMISSTARDLPEHRKEAMDACLRQGMFPEMMEHLPASDDGCDPASLEMVDRADIYLGIFAHRYGYVPKENNPRRISVTEMEYNRAVERKIPRLIFVMDKDHPITIDRCGDGRGRDRNSKTSKSDSDRSTSSSFFKSPADLRALVINRLSQHIANPTSPTFHYVSDIPARARGVHRAPVHPPADAPAGRPAGGAQSADRLGGGQDPWGFGNPKGLASSTSSRSAGWARAR